MTGASFTCAKIAPKGCMVLAAGDDQNNIILWKLTNTKPKIILEGHQTEPSCMQFNEESTRLFTGTVGGTAHVWDLQSASQVSMFRGHQANVTAVCSSNGD